MSKNLNQEAAKAPDLVKAGIDEATQAAQKNSNVGSSDPNIHPNPITPGGKAGTFPNPTGPGGE